MKSLGVLCLLVMFAFLQDSSCLDAVGKVRSSDRLIENLDVLQKDSQFDPLAPVSQHSELFEIAKRLAQKKELPEGRDPYGGYHKEMNNMDRFEHYTKQFLDLSVRISYSAVYLLQNYTRFVQNANNKYIVGFE